MPDPFAPTRTRQVSERQSPLDAVLARLRRCGATEDELATVRENWPPAERDLAEFYAMASDEELAKAILEVREEFEYGTLTDDDRDDQWRARAEELAKGPARLLEEWVGDDPERAALALEVELAKPKPRVGLSAHLAGVRDGSPS